MPSLLKVIGVLAKSGCVVSFHPVSNEALEIRIARNDLKATTIHIDLRYMINADEEQANEMIVNELYRAIGMVSESAYYGMRAAFELLMTHGKPPPIKESDGH